MDPAWRPLASLNAMLLSISPDGSFCSWRPCLRLGRRFRRAEILPGNAAQVMLGASATPETVAALAHKLGLDQGLIAPLRAWIGRRAARRSRQFLRL